MQCTFGVKSPCMCRSQRQKTGRKSFAVWPVFAFVALNTISTHFEHFPNNDCTPPMVTGRGICRIGANRKAELISAKQRTGTAETRNRERDRMPRSARQ